MDWSSISDLVGMVGVILVVAAYFFLMAGHWKVEKMLFSLTNLGGALCILFSLFFHWNLASVVIELIWVVISCYKLGFFLRQYLKRIAK
jgi:hypothetical protein